MELIQVIRKTVSRVKAWTTENFYKKNEVEDALGDIETALDSIIAIQNTLIGGESE